MELNPDHSDAAYLALKVRDARFDGQWFVGVKSTGVYCRPVCRVKTPGRAQCRFFELAAQAEHAGFRPCLKCRPELAAGVVPRFSTMDARGMLARQAMSLIRQEAAHGLDVGGLASRLGVSARHLHRLLEEQYGLAPLEAIHTQRLLLAKQWLTDTPLPLEDVAALSGFGSARRLGEMFLQRYKLSPDRWRKAHAVRAEGAEGGAGQGALVVLSLQAKAGWREESAWAFRLRRALPGVEHLQSQGMARRWTLAVPARVLSERSPAGVIRLEWQAWPEGGSTEPLPTADPLAARTASSDDSSAHWHGVRPRPLKLALPASLWPWATEVVSLVRRIWDLDAPQADIDAHLAGWPGRAGVLLPGAPDPFELLVRAVLGQQVSVAAARTLCARLMARHGTPVESAWPEDVHQCFPRAETLAGLQAEDWQAFGVMPSRAATLCLLAQRWSDIERLWREASRPLATPEAPARLQEALLALPGIGTWTASYIVLRSLSLPDMWLPGDVALLQSLWQAQPWRLGELPARPARWTRAIERGLAEALQAASPWRSYLVMRLWDAAAPPPAPPPAEPLPRRTVRARSRPPLDTHPAETASTSDLGASHKDLLS